MQFFHFRLLEKYTAAMLDLFREIEVQTFSDPDINGNVSVISSFYVPIEFGSKSKAYIFDNTDYERLKQGNVNILPRMSLTFLGVERDPERNTGKLTQINQITGDSTVDYRLNAVPYNFKFQLSVATKTVLDASIIIEQIAPYFNPSYSILIKELDDQTNFTSVPVFLEGIETDIPEDIDEQYDIRIIKADLNFVVKGHMYPPVESKTKITKKMMTIGNVLPEIDLTNYVDQIFAPGVLEFNAEGMDFRVDTVSTPIGNVSKITIKNGNLTGVYENGLITFFLLCPDNNTLTFTSSEDDTIQIYSLDLSKKYNLNFLDIVFYFEIESTIVEGQKYTSPIGTSIVWSGNNLSFMPIGTATIVPKNLVDCVVDNVSPLTFLRNDTYSVFRNVNGYAKEITTQKTC